jgi:hypothetical protein
MGPLLIDGWDGEHRVDVGGRLWWAEVLVDPHLMVIHARDRVGDLSDRGEVGSPAAKTRPSPLPATSTLRWPSSVATSGD